MTNTTTQSRVAPRAPHKLPIRTLVAASVGNAVEWYDWTVYATYSVYFATQIFSADNVSLAFIGTFATYALGFVGLLVFTVICLVVSLTMRRASRMPHEVTA